jgi:hypothetical protein
VRAIHYCPALPLFSSAVSAASTSTRAVTPCLYATTEAVIVIPECTNNSINSSIKRLAERTVGMNSDVYLLFAVAGDVA